MTARRRRRLAREDGLTLIEMLVAAGIMLAAFAIVVPMLTTMLRDQPQVSEKAANVQQARTVLERLTRELRQGLAVDSATPTELVLRTYTRRTTCASTSSLPSGSPSRLCRITYACTSGTCTRQAAEADGSSPGTAVQFATGLANAEVFTYAGGGSPTHVQVTLVLPDPEGEGNLTLRDGASLRNALLDN